MVIAICDDSKVDSKLSETLITEYFKKLKKQCTVKRYETGASLISDFDDGVSFDIVFMDIYVGNELGMDIARQLRSLGYTNILIFSTITSEYAIESYSVNASGYILKPYGKECFERVLDRVLEKYINDAMRVKVRNSYMNIPYERIIYIESCNNRCILHTAEEEYHLYMHLDDIEKSVCNEEKRFLRCHRSYIVNMDHVSAVDEQFLLDNGESVLIRSKSRAQVKKHYLDYIKGTESEKI